MNAREALHHYKMNMRWLQLQKEELLDKIKDLREQLEQVEYAIHEKQVEIDECEADILNPEYEE